MNPVGFFEEDQMPRGNDSPRARFQKRVQAAREMLRQRGCRSLTPIFIAAIDAEDSADDLDSSSGAKPLARIVEATASVAAVRMAEKSHRLATAEEIERFHREQSERETECGRIEQMNRESDGKGGSASMIAAAIREAIAPAKDITEPAAPASSGKTEKRQGKETS